MLVAELFFILILIEIMIFIGFDMKKKVWTLRKIPFFNPGYPDERIVAYTNAILYRNVFGLRLIRGNCVRYVLMLYWAFYRKYNYLKVVIGVKKLKNGLSGHTWLEKCNKLFYEPESTKRTYRKMGEFR